MTTAPLGRWSDEGVLRELARLARALQVIDVDEAHSRLERLTTEQRGVLVTAVGRLADDEPDVG